MEQIGSTAVADSKTLTPYATYASMVPVYSLHFMSLIAINDLAYSISILFRKIILNARNLP